MKNFKTLVGMHGFKVIGGINMLQANLATDKSTLSKGRHNNKMSKQKEGRFNLTHIVC